MHLFGLFDFYDWIMISLQVLNVKNFPVRLIKILWMCLRNRREKPNNVAISENAVPMIVYASAFVPFNIIRKFYREKSANKAKWKKNCSLQIPHRHVIPHRMAHDFAQMPQKQTVPSSWIISTLPYQSIWVRQQRDRTFINKTTPTDHNFVEYMRPTVRDFQRRYEIKLIHKQFVDGQFFIGEIIEWKIASHHDDSYTSKR